MKKFLSGLFKKSKKLTDKRRVGYLHLISVLGLASSLILTASAWGLMRTYPLSTIISSLNFTHEVQENFFLLSVITLLASLLFKTYRKSLVTVSLVSLVLLLLQDITRLQPWILHYGAVLLLFSWFIKGSYSNTKILDAARIVVGGIYFWSGMQKLNIYFFSEVFPWFTKSLWEPLGEYGLNLFIFLGLLVPFVEAAFAFGFFSKRFRKISILGATIMILLVLVSIGPTGHEWNSSVWPWNIGIFAMVLVLFYGKSFTFKEFLLRQRKNIAGIIAFCIFWIIPAGNLFGLTDHYLSWSLYTGKVPEAVLHGDQLFLESLSDSADNGKLVFQRWTQSDINMVPYPEVRVFEDIFEKVCTENPSQPLTLKISNKSYGFLVTEEILKFECN